MRGNRQEAYYSGDGISTTSEGKQVCEAFAWVDLGVMAGLWLLLLVVQSYLCLYVYTRFPLPRMNGTDD